MAGTYLLDLLAPFFHTTTPQVSTISTIHLKDCKGLGGRNSTYLIPRAPEINILFCLLFPLIPPSCIPFVQSLFCHLSLAYHYALLPPLPTPNSVTSIAYIVGLMKVDYSPGWPPLFLFFFPSSQYFDPLFPQISLPGLNFPSTRAEHRYVLHSAFHTRSLSSLIGTYYICC